VDKLGLDAPPWCEGSPKYNIHSLEVAMFMQSMTIILAIALGACTQMQPMQSKAPTKDGEPTVPANFKTWPKMLTDIQRPDAKQVRDMYIDPAGAKTRAGEPFPYGTIMVMENYAAVAKPDGTLETGADGKLVRGPLLRIFVMEKAKGAGMDVPEALRNGEWVYASYAADGKKTDDNLMACRGCHLTVPANKDFVHRYDEYFQKRAAQ
jgi:hemoglobin